MKGHTLGSHRKLGMGRTSLSTLRVLLMGDSSVFPQAVWMLHSPDYSPEAVLLNEPKV